MNISNINSRKDMNKDRKLKFEERIQYLVLMLTFYKSRCEDLMKGNGIEELVASAKRKYLGSKTNKHQNGKRQVVLIAGKEATRAKKAQVKSGVDGEVAEAKVEEPKQMFAGPFGIVGTATERAVDIALTADDDAMDVDADIDWNTSTRGLDNSHHATTPKGKSTNMRKASAH